MASQNRKTTKKSPSTKTFRSKVLWVQSTDLVVEAQDEEEAQKRVTEMLKQSSVIWNSWWDTESVRIASVEETRSEVEITE